MNILHAAALAAAIEALSSGHAQVLATELRSILEGASAAVPTVPEVIPVDPQAAPHVARVASMSRDMLTPNATRCRTYRARKKARRPAPLQIDMWPREGMSLGHVATCPTPPDLNIAVGERVTLHASTALDDILRAAARHLAPEVAERSWRRFVGEHYGETFNRKRLMGRWIYWLTMEKVEPPPQSKPTAKLVVPRGMSPPVRDAPSDPMPRAELHAGLTTLMAGLA